MIIIPGVDFIAISVSFYCNDGKGNFVLHKRSKNCRDDVGCWDCGGGQLEFGEDVVGGVLREVKEEYGCDGIIQQQLPCYSLFRENGNSKTHWLNVPFLVKVDFAQLKNGDPDKIEEIKIFRFDDLPELLHPGFVEITTRYKEIFEKYK